MALSMLRIFSDFQLCCKTGPSILAPRQRKRLGRISVLNTRPLPPWSCSTWAPTRSTSLKIIGSSAYPDASLLSGSLTTNWVPFSLSESTSIKPLCSSTIFLAIMRPRPVPFDPFVLKKSLKTLLWVSSSMPTPLSMTWYSTAQPSGFRERSRTSPFLSGRLTSEQASTALVTRFRCHSPRPWFSSGRKLPGPASWDRKIGMQAAAPWHSSRDQGPSSQSCPHCV